MYKFLLLAFFLCAAPASAKARPDAVMDAAVHDLCTKDVALLGEADHGDGRTIEFKAALVEQLVKRCHYNAVFFEASHYDFMALERKIRLGQPSSADMLSSAIGGIWNHDEELRQLIPFLYAEAKKGKIRLGGLDDQLGAAGAFYSLSEMPAELAGKLTGNRRAECADALRRRVSYDFAKPYDAAEQTRIDQCLAEIASAVSASNSADRSIRDEQRQMVASLRRALARDFADQSANFGGRDRSMYDNFQWLAQRLPPRSKVIVWAATVHVAKDASAVPKYAKAANLGSFIHRAYGRHSFVLGFTAASGTHYWSRQEPSRPVEAAASGSIETDVLARASGKTAYVDSSGLSRLGTKVGGALYYHNPLTPQWSDIIDGLVVFPKERPPQRLDKRLSYP